MEVDQDLIKAILNQLNEAYPRRIDNQDYIVKEHKNRAEIVNYLFYLINERLIEFKDWSSRTKKACGLIRIIIPEGLTYLKDLLKKGD